MFDLTKLLNRKSPEAIVEKEKIARLLKTTPQALKAFEDAYKENVLLNDSLPDNFFDINAKQAAAACSKSDTAEVNTLIEKIVEELLTQTDSYSFDGKEERIKESVPAIGPTVSNEEIQKVPEHVRPQLTGFLMKRDIKDPAYKIIVEMYRKYLETGNKQYYHMFRQGLDIQDLDDITYEMIGTNPNSMGRWLPQLVAAAKDSAFFKIPATTIVKVPMTLLQLTRLEYGSLISTTLQIVDRFCQKAFHLDGSKEYFIKTGTYSSKYDFRNAYVHGAKEVRELGEYLLYIHHQAVMMAGSLTSPCIYGVSTTNEWVVREFIPDKENNPSIYKGLPLHTEYRVFVDCDTDEVIGISPYWEPNVMKQRFGHEKDANSPHQIHDYVIYQMHEETLMKRYEKNKDRVKEEVENLLPKLNLTGQWSIDIMQNGDDFWLIDMALAQDSALIECVPEQRRKAVEENWIPKLLLDDGDAKKITGEYDMPFIPFNASEEIKKRYQKDTAFQQEWNNMLKEAQKKKETGTFYHITTPECVDSILKNGLMAQIGENAKLVGTEDPYVYLCYEKDIPFWMILLQSSVILEITGFKGVLESYPYNGYAELIALDSIPAKYIHVSDLKPDLSEAMKHLCISYVYTLSNLCAEIMNYYENKYPWDKEYRDGLMEDIRSVAQTLKLLDYTCVPPEELKQAIWDSGDGSYSFVGRYQNDYEDENSYIWKKIVSEETDLLYLYTKELSQTIQEKFPNFLYMDRQ